VTIQELRKHWGAAPFRPFRMHLDDGREFPIDHPEFLYLGPVGRVAVVEDFKGNIELIDPLLVTSLSVASDRTESPTN
jgi:hypothetical protein